MSAWAAYPEGPFRTVHARLVDQGLVDGRESRGLSEGELEEISRDQGVPLDPEYADFPRCMGAGRGRTLAGETVFRSAVRGIRAGAEAMCAELGIDGCVLVRVPLGRVHG
ncbi:hypothetical protein [Streptomyces tauricus]|uniref:hypothetical protein n=1 Tax=Streptomyces tauricus TaxID=68274 RepID=UPI002244B187|nr:hypothetical protein [Streptomyces tauricus]MCW8102351.1 hypothetical protein [Streptomyces tauricus]